jgi:hypothetical protein
MFGKAELPQVYRFCSRLKQGVRGIRTVSTLVIREWAGRWEAG